MNATEVTAIVSSGFSIFRVYATYRMEETGSGVQVRVLSCGVRRAALSMANGQVAGTASLGLALNPLLLLGSWGAAPGSLPISHVPRSSISFPFFTSTALCLHPMKMEQGGQSSLDTRILDQGLVPDGECTPP